MSLQEKGRIPRLALQAQPTCLLLMQTPFAAERWAKNVQFLDEAIARGDAFRLSTDVAARISKLLIRCFIDQHLGTNRISHAHAESKRHRYNLRIGAMIVKSTQRRCNQGVLQLLSMISREKLAIYEKFEGDIDRFARLPMNAIERALIAEPDWRLIEELLNRLYLYASELTAASFDRGTDLMLAEHVADAAVEGRLRALARARAEQR